MKKDEIEHRLEALEAKVAQREGFVVGVHTAMKGLRDDKDAHVRVYDKLSQRLGELEEWRERGDRQKAWAVEKVGELQDRVDELERRLEIVERRGEPEAHCTKDWATCEHGIGVCGARRCDKDGLLCPWPKGAGEAAEPKCAHERADCQHRARWPDDRIAPWCYLLNADCLWGRK